MDRTVNQVGAGQWSIAKPIEYRLAGRLVNREMYNDVVSAKRAGLRVILTTPGGSVMDETHDVKFCRNCGGMGRLYLQSLIAGPFREPPQHDPAQNAHIGLHNGAWYKMTLQPYSCPVCVREIVL